MTADQNRYQRDKERREREARHDRIVSLLAGDVVADFEAVRDVEGAKCHTGQFPNRWVDWDKDPELAEEYEGPMPTAEEAQEWCEGCPLMVNYKGGQPLCYAYARATGKTHGVWGGVRIYDGKRVGWNNNDR